MRKFFLLFCACNILFLSARESTLAAVTKSVPKIYSSRQPLVYSAKSIETQHYIRTMNYLITKDYIGLRFAQEEGLNINAKSKNGDTAVCTSIKRKQYHWFNMLKSAGADMYADCVKSIDIEKRDQFIDNYIKMGGSIDLDTKDALLVTSPVNWWSVGGIVGGVALAGGVTALALSGGGSSSSSNSSEGGASHGENADIPNGKPVKYPTNPTTSDVTNPEYYKTAEFGGSNFKPVQNFLGQVNAQYAYAYAAAAGKNIAGEGIVIGEVDTGVDYSHQELSSRIATDANDKKLAINFHYGPCKEGDKRNCWVVENNFAYFYGASETVEKSSYLGTLNYSYWIKYKNSFPDDYDWDENKNASIIYSASSGSGAEYIKQAVHGTHVAGIMVAEKNGKWMHGLAYNSKIISAGIDLGWLPSSNGYGILPSYQYLISNGAKVINNSWGSSETLVKDVLANVNNFNQQYEDDLKLALSYTASKSVVSLFAAGNDAANNEGNQKNAGLTAAAPMAIPELLYYRDSNGELQAFLIIFIKIPQFLMNR